MICIYFMRLKTPQDLQNRKIISSFCFVFKVVKLKIKHVERTLKVYYNTTNSINQAEFLQMSYHFTKFL